MSAPSSVWISMARSGDSSTMAPSMMRAEGDALFSSILRKLRQRHHLEAAGIGEDRMRPVHEFVQAAERRDALRARPQHQMIGVAEQDFGAGLAHRFGRQALHRRLGADRHEGRRLHRAVRRRDLAAARRAVGCDQRGRKRRRSSIAAEQQASIAVGIETIARRDRMRIGALHRVEAAEGRRPA